MDDKDIIIQSLKDQIKTLTAFYEAKIASLESRIAELERRLGLDSSTSSKPPSSDGLGKKARSQSLRSTGSRPSGGQKGHPGKTLSQVAVADEEIIHEEEQCPQCGSSLETAPVKTILKRQVFDIPPPQVQVTEHQVPVKVCSCGCEVRSSFPDAVTAPVHYGPRLQAIARYLMHGHFIPEDRLSDLMDDLFQVPMTSASLVKMGQKLETKLLPWIESLKEKLRNVRVNHLDETGFRIGGKTQWLHSQSTLAETYYRPSDKRGDVPTDLEGIVVHDHFKPYYKQLNKNRHALCNGHHLRELKALQEIEKEPWAFKMSQLLKLSNACTAPPVERICRLYDTIIEQGLAFHESQPELGSQSRGRKKRRVGHNLLIRLRDYKADVLRFLTDEEVPFTNNLAEQDIRMMKVKQKISGGFRTQEGAETFCILRSFFSTCRKRNVNIFDAITKTLQNQNPITI